MSINKNVIPVVDLFAGPGGLGEGFSSLKGDPFRILVSAEMDEFAHRTLSLRAFYRILKRRESDDLKHYYAYCNEGIPIPDTPEIRAAWREVQSESLRLTLGQADDNQRLDNVIKLNGLSDKNPWVLIGGPPCQAYSLVGRARNKGKTDYRPEEDHRHFLYKEYLRIIQKYRPAIFVMENVKGILSSSVANEQMFRSILEDLTQPDIAVGHVHSRRAGYRIFSLSHDTRFDSSSDFASIDPKKFIVRAEEYGVPQARHRVILLGIRTDLLVEKISPLTRGTGDGVSVQDVIAELPALRSHLSRRPDDALEWAEIIKQHLVELGQAAKDKNLDTIAKAFAVSRKEINADLQTGDLRFPKVKGSKFPESRLNSWYRDSNLKVWLNHEARGHMESDLMRYVYAAVYAKTNGRSPKGHEGFDLSDKLRPSHANWESGKFADRFKVQMWGGPSTTITSHISKDGHYFIHPDPVQCRSLTVREAARLQTFPDNYFFQGNRTQQYHQVGNAVPPYLANQIARVVQNILQK